MNPNSEALPNPLETERQTRERIDMDLKKAGWDVKNRTMVIQEVDTKQSNFRTRNYKTVDETLKNDLESKYADYLLLDEGQNPLAIVEAKRAAKDPFIAKTQAREYAEDIKAQTGKDVFIFFTNGTDTYFWNINYEPHRMVKGFFSREALERIRWHNLNKKSTLDIKVNKKIVNRNYQLDAVKSVLEGIEGGKRKFLIVQATGTGKTRVAMAIIDILRRSNRVKKVLFLADRTALRGQACTEGFAKYIPDEEAKELFSSELDKDLNLYAATIQTMMECYRSFSPGDFDLIISDEAHRSIYNKWKDVFTYFDAIQIGLTATPSDSIEKDTFRFFECNDGKPTSLYTFEEATDEKYLVNFKTVAVSTHFQIEGIKPADVPSAIKSKLSEDGIEDEDLYFDGTDIEKKVIVKGTNEAIVKEVMDNCLVDRSGMLPAKTIIFAMTKEHAKRICEAFDKLYPQYGGRLVERIVSDDPRAKELMHSFKVDSLPRIAVSVDMLDTGVNVPEVCNLVFAKPVFSKIKFWQMIGRGTRNDEACDNKDWLPDGKKEYFLIFDFWNNMEWFKMHPEGKEVAPQEAVTTKIFLMRLRQYGYFLDQKDDIMAEKLRHRLTESVKTLPMDSVSVREKEREVVFVTSGKLWNRGGADQLEFLKTKISPLMKFQPDININEASFTLKVERLALAILNKNEKEIDDVAEEVRKDVRCLSPNINKVKEKKEIIEKILDVDGIGKNATFDETIAIIDELGPLMVYKRADEVPKITLDIGDIIQQRRLIEFGPMPNQEYIEVYKKKVENRIRELAENHPTIQKIKEDNVLVEADLQNLEKTLNSPELYITEDTLRKVYERHNGTLVEFIKVVLGLYKFPDPKQRIAEAFRTFMVENSEKLMADQIRFLRAVQTTFEAKKHIEYRDFFEPPFTNIGNAPIPLFTKDELMGVLRLCNTLENEVYINTI